MSKTQKTAYALSPAKSYRHVVEGIASDIRQINSRLPIFIPTDDHRNIDPMAATHSSTTPRSTNAKATRSGLPSLTHSPQLPQKDLMTVFTCLAKTAHEICARHQCICASVKLGVVFRQEEAKPLTSSVTYAWDIEMHRHKKQDLDMALGDQINPLLPTARGWVPTACALRRALDSWEAIGDTQINHSTIAQLPCLTYQWCETPLDRIAFADASIACWKEYQNCHE